MVFFGLFMAAEIAARVFDAYRGGPVRNHGEESFFIPHPYLNYALNPEHPEHSAEGFRKPHIALPAKDTDYLIFCMGGSSTYGTEVTKEEAYPAQLDHLIQQSGEINSHIHVINAGCPGYTSANNFGLLQFKILPLHPKLLIFNIAFNDVAPRFHQTVSYDYEEHFQVWQNPSAWMEILFSSRIMQKIGSRLRIWPPHIMMLIRKHTNDDNLIKPETLVPSSTAVYRQNLKSMIVLAKAYGANVLILTQPYCPGRLEPSHDAAYQKGVKQHNDILRELAAVEKVPLLDMDRDFERRPEYYADCIHMTARGETVRSETIFKELKKLNVVR